MSLRAVSIPELQQVVAKDEAVEGEQAVTSHPDFLVSFHSILAYDRLRPAQDHRRKANHLPSPNHLRIL